MSFMYSETHPPNWITDLERKINAQSDHGHIIKKDKCSHYFVSTVNSWDGAAQCSALYVHIKEVHYWKADYVTGTGQTRGYKQKNLSTRQDAQTSLPLERRRDKKAFWGEWAITQGQVWLLPYRHNSSSIKLEWSSAAFDVIRLAMAFFSRCMQWIKGNLSGRSNAHVPAFLCNPFFHLTRPSCLPSSRAVHLGEPAGIMKKNMKHIFQ